MIVNAKIHLTLTENGIDVEIVTQDNIPKQTKESLPQHTQSFGWACLTWNRQLVCQWHAPVVRFGKAQVELPPSGFMQATDYGQQTLTNFAVYAVGKAKQVVDLFCGAGTFSFPLATTAEVTAFEQSPELIQALNHAIKHANGLKPITAHRRDLFKNPLTDKELSKFDAAVINPPRAGAKAQMMQLAKANLPVIVYLSCNPQSFASDAKILIDAGYKLAVMVPIDQFLWSSHIEIASQFIKG